MVKGLGGGHNRQNIIHTLLISMVSNFYTHYVNMINIPYASETTGTKYQVCKERILAR